MITTATYTRGTKTTRITTAKLANTPGAWVLTKDGSDEYKARLAAKNYAADAAVSLADTKTGSTLRQVERAEAVMHAANGYYRRAQRTYTIHFTDGSYAYGNAPANTWMTVDAPAAEVNLEVAAAAARAKVQAELAATEEPATPAATKAYRIGKLLREFVLAGDDNGHHAVSPALRDHVASRNVCYDGTATLRLTVAFAAELVIAASAMEAEAKAAAAAAQRTLAALFA